MPITLISRKLLKTNRPPRDHVERNFLKRWSIKSRLDIRLSNLKLIWSIQSGLNYGCVLAMEFKFVFIYYKAS